MLSDALKSLSGASIVVDSSGTVCKDLQKTCISFSLVNVRKWIF